MPFNFRHLACRLGRARRSSRRVLAAIALALTAPLWTSAAAESVGEQQLKAAFLYNFTKFVEWPAERFSDATDPIVIASLADAPLEAEIEAMVANRQVNGRPLIALPVRSAADMEAAHVLFVGARQESRYLSMRKQAQLSAVLTVGDSESCRAYEGDICFMLQGTKLRFEINMGNVERSHLKISAQLQKLAVAVNKGH